MLNIEPVNPPNGLLDVAALEKSEGFVEEGGGNEFETGELKLKGFSEVDG